MEPSRKKEQMKDVVYTLGTAKLVEIIDRMCSDEQSFGRRSDQITCLSF